MKRCERETHRRRSLRCMILREQESSLSKLNSCTHAIFIGHHRKACCRDSLMQALVKLKINYTSWFKEILEAGVRAQAAFQLMREAFGVLSENPKMYLHNAGNAGASAGVSLTMVEESYGWAQRQKVLRWAERDRVDLESKKLKNKKIRSQGAKKKRLLKLCLPELKKRKEKALKARKALTVRRKKQLKRRKQDDDDLNQAKVARDAGGIGVVNRAA